MICKKCKQDIRPDCVLTNDTCVFCYYKTKTWDSNGWLVKKKDAVVPKWLSDKMRSVIDKYVEKKYMKVSKEVSKKLRLSSVKSAKSVTSKKNNLTHIRFRLTNSTK